MDSPVTSLIDALVRELTERKHSIPRRSLLESLFNTTFYCTLERDEGQAIRFDLTYLDPSNPDPDPPFRIRSDRWIYVPFAEPLGFNIASIAKVALASDQRTSMLVVYPDDASELRIWGFIDQGINSYRFRSYESSSGFGYPGLFQLSAIDVGHLVLRIDFEQIAELRGESVNTKPLDVLEDGAVPAALMPVFERLARSSSPLIRALQLDHDDSDALHLMSEETLRSLRRLLSRVQGYGHGGAVLITPSIRGNQLNIKHKINYLRLARAIQKVAVLEEHSEKLFRAILEMPGDPAKTSIPMSRHLETVIFDNELEDAQSELNGSLWFASLLSRIDGLVLMDKSLVIRGFGVEITVAKPPDAVWLAGDVEASESARVELPYEHYGTRHRSMMRYVARVPGSVGFVVSQDRGVRAMTMIESDLVIWDNVQLQQDFNVHEIRKPSPDTGVTATSHLASNLASAHAQADVV